MFARFLLATAIALGSFVPSASAQSGIENVLRQTVDRILGDKDTTSQIQDADTSGADRVPATRQEIQLSFAPIVRQVSGSVVNVYGKRRRPEFRSPFADDPFFQRFFGIPQFRERQQNSLGSGVIVGEDGIILTNHHVIENMDEIRIALADGREFDCEIVLKDKKSDLAVLKADADVKLKPIEIADSENVEVGDLVLAIGNPFGVGQTVTSGIVSALSRSLAGVDDYGFFIQTDAAINPGNSGGALVDMQGRLIGINTMIYTRGGGSIGIGYAVPSNMAQVVLASARTGDRVTRPWIGATFQNVTSEIAESMGLDRTSGAIVIDVARAGPADEAGIRPGDIVLSIDGKPVEHPDALGYRLDTIGVGRSAELGLLSRGKRKQVSLPLAEAPETTPRNITNMPRNSVLDGATAANLSPAFAQEIGLSSATEGVVVLRVASDSLAAYHGLRAGDVVLEVNDQEVTEVGDLADLAAERRRNWQFVVERRGREIVLERQGGFFRQFAR